MIKSRRTVLTTFFSPIGHYRPPESGRVFDMKVVSSYVFRLEKITANHVSAIDARLRSRNSTVSVKAETAECVVARDSIIA